MGLRFVLKCHASLITPDSILKKKPSSCDRIEALLRIGQVVTFKVYVPASAINRERLLDLCDKLPESDLDPAPEGIIKSLYPRDTSKLVTHIDILWTLYPQGLPPYDPSTALGVSNEQSTGQSNSRLTSSSRASRKRRISSTAPRCESFKRQLMTEKADSKPWELAIMAQGA